MRWLSVLGIAVLMRRRSTDHGRGQEPSHVGGAMMPVRWFCVFITVVMLGFAGEAGPGNGKVKPGINKSALTRNLMQAFEQLGPRLAGPDTNRVILSGTLTDARGSRPAIVVWQYPGLFRLEKQGPTRTVLTFDGLDFSKGGEELDAYDDKLIESLLAHFPEQLFAQAVSGGAVRHIGSRFVAPYGESWDVYELHPAPRSEGAGAHGLSQVVHVAFDSRTKLASAVRYSKNEPATKTFIQTRFSRWWKKGNQMFPGLIVRTENGAETLRFDINAADVGPAADPAVFRQ